jgi:spore germination protein YaaH
MSNSFAKSEIFRKRILNLKLKESEDSMKIKNLSIVGIAALAVAMSACPAATNTNTGTNNSNANKTAVVVNATNNSTANTANTNTTTTNAAAVTDGQVIKIDEAGIMMTVPKGFKFSKDGEDTVVQTEDEGVDIRFSVPKDGDYAKVLTDAAKEVDDYLDNVVVVNKGSDIDVNGMKGWSMSGTAKNEGEDVSWDLTIIDAPKKPVLANIYAEKSSMEKHMADVKAFFKSVKKQ